MAVTAAQVRTLMKEIGRGKSLGVAAMKADMDRKTARKYSILGALPPKQPRQWRTHADVFEEDWADIEAFLELIPQVEAKSLFQWLLHEKPDRYREGQLRTFQRRVRCWRASRAYETEAAVYCNVFRLLHLTLEVFFKWRWKFFACRPTLTFRSRNGGWNFRFSAKSEV